MLVLEMDNRARLRRIEPGQGAYCWRGPQGGSADVQTGERWLDHVDHATAVNWRGLANTSRIFRIESQGLTKDDENEQSRAIPDDDDGL